MIGSVVRTNDLVAFLIQKALVGLIIVDLFHSCQIWFKMWPGLLGIQINLWITELISKRYHFRKKIKKMIGIDLRGLSRVLLLDYLATQV
jgi:hypothetical protein